MGFEHVGHVYHYELLTRPYDLAYANFLDICELRSLTLFDSCELILHMPSSCPLTLHLAHIHLVGLGRVVGRRFESHLDFRLVIIGV